MVSLVLLIVEIVQSVEVNFADVDNRFPSIENSSLSLSKVQMNEKSLEDDRRVKSSKYKFGETTSDLTDLFFE